MKLTNSESAEFKTNPVPILTALFKHHKSTSIDIEDEVEAIEEVVEITTQLFIKSKEQRLVTGVVMPVMAEGAIQKQENGYSFKGKVFETDLDGDFSTAPEIHKSMVNFMLGSGGKSSSFNKEHSSPVSSDGVALVEIFAAPVDYEMGGVLIRKGSWLITNKIFDDNLWEGIQDGTYTGLSPEGRCTKLRLPNNK